MKFSEIAADKRGALERLCYLFLIFLIGCLAGWIYEVIFYWFSEGLLRNRGILYGPWLPIYGVGALAVYAMKGLKEKPAALFLLCFGVTAVVEYIIGYVGIRFFDLRLWDYRGLFMNLNGIICLRSVMSFSIMGLALHYLLEPIAAKLYRRLSFRRVAVGCMIIAAIFILDCILSLLFRTPITY